MSQDLVPLIRDVQASLGLKVDGVAGPVTWSAIHGKLVPPARPVSPIGQANSELSPLSPGARAAMFGGQFKYEPAPTRDNPEGIKILGGWEALNIIRVEIPQLAAATRGQFTSMRFNRKAAKQLLALWAAWAEARLIGQILSFDGAFVARFVRGSSSVLSNHAFGTAFDINADWNGLGETPAAVGQRGSVRELVAIAEEHGFFWGGNFRRPDGMHFEVARLIA